MQAANLASLAPDLRCRYIAQRGTGDRRLPVIVVKTLERRQYLAPPLGVGDQFASNLAGRDAIEGGVNGGELRAMGQFTGLGEPQRHRSGLLIGIA